MRSIVFCISLAVFSIAVSDSKADALVLQSTSVKVAVGRVIPSGSTISIRRGERVDLLIDDGELIGLRGPATFTAPNVARPKQGLLQAYAEMFRARPDRIRLGGVRGEEGASPCVETGAPQDWTSIAASWNAGCRDLALERLRTQLKALKPS